MSHTIRAYNKRPIRGGPGIRGWLTSRDRSIRPLVLAGKAYQWAIADEDICYDYVYRPYGTYCMGHCSWCKRFRFLPMIADRKRREMRFMQLEVENVT